jgi:hypothetical protein
MSIKRLRPLTLDVENVVFVSFPTARYTRRYTDQLCADVGQAIADLKATLEGTRALTRSLAALVTPGGVPSDVLAQAVAAEARTLNSEASSQAQHIA